MSSEPRTRAEATNQELRESIRQAHEAIADLRRERAELRRDLAEVRKLHRTIETAVNNWNRIIAAMVEQHVDAAVGEELKANLDSMRGIMNRAIDNWLSKRGNEILDGVIARLDSRIGVHAVRRERKDD